MADSILRLKVDSQEYDSKIKRASSGLLSMEEACRKVGDTFEVVEKEQLAFVQALGKMQTVSNTARGKIGELTSAFTDLSTMYNRLTDAEKKSPFGKALAGSLDELKGRIKDGKKELDDIGKSINGGSGLSGALDSFAGKFGMNISQLTSFGAILGTATGALKVAKDAFFSNEQNLDEWGRTVEASKSLYEGFLDSLNTGDISGYLSRVGQIAQAARDAYDALDALGTYNAFNQVNIQKTRTGMTEAIADYREGKGSKEGVKSASAAYKKELKDRQKMEQDAYNEAIKSIAASRGVDAKMLDAVMKGTYGNYQTLKDTKMTGKRTYTQVGSWGQSYTREEAIPANQTEKLGAMLRRLNDTELKNLQALGAQAQRTGEEIAQVDKQTARVLGSKAGTGSGGKGGNTAVTASAQGSIKWYEEEIAKLNKTLQSSTDAEVRGNAQYMIAEYQAAIAKIKRQAEGSVYAMRRASFVAPGENNTNLNGDFTSKPSTSTLSTQLQIADPKAFENAKNLANIGKAVGSSWQEAARAIGSIGSALSQIENPAAKVFGIIAEAVANVALGFANALANSKTGKLSVWAWIAEAAAGVGTMISTIAAIKSATSGSYANGGIIPGTNYSGDQLTANVNSGELILNKAQQGNLASQLNGGGMNNLHLETVLYGEDVRIMLRNNSRRRGKGEYVTSR